MSMTDLLREKVYVLGPLELSPQHFAVGETTYAAIKGRWPFYNDMRQKLYVEGRKQEADAIGNLEARASAVEKKLESKCAALRMTEGKLREANRKIADLEKTNASLVKEIEDLKKPKKKKGKESSNDKLDSKLAAPVAGAETVVAGTGGDGEGRSGAGGEGRPEAE